MATVDPETLGKRVAEARMRAGLTQAELAAAASLDRSALAKIENGVRRVSAIELARLAAALHERIEWFVVDPPPAVVSRRNLDEPGAPSPALDRLLERVARNVEFVIAHDRRTPATPMPVIPRPETVEATEQAARQARKSLGLNASDPVLDLPSKAAEIGVFGFSFNLGNDAADGASMLLGDAGVAVVNGHLHVGRRRLALAHEMGHCLFADEYTVDWRVAQFDDVASSEARIDRFARAFLLPKSGLDLAWSRFRANGASVRDAAVRTASVFRVDMATLARRLAELGQATGLEEREIRAARTTKADIVEFNLLVADEMAVPFLPRSYQESVIRLYRDETVSPDRAIDLLFDTWDEAELPMLPPLPENRIWDFVS